MSHKQVYPHRTYFTDKNMKTASTKDDYNASVKVLNAWKKNPQGDAPATHYCLTTYFTKPDGKGDKVKKVVAMGKGVYLDKEKLTPPEINKIKGDNVERLVKPKIKALQKVMKSLGSACSNPLVRLDNEQKQRVMGYVKLFAQELESSIFKPVKESVSIEL